MTSLKENTPTISPSNAPLEVWQVILIFIAFMGVVVLFAFLKKIWYRVFYKKTYYIIPRTQIKGIANVAMVISMAIAIIFTLTIISANGLGVLFRAYAGTRIAIESLLIRVGGLLFGPLIGSFIGAMTDLLAVVLTSGVFHYGYFFAAISYGLLAGLVKTILVYSKNRNFSFAIFSTTAIVCLFGIIFIFFSLQKQESYEINVFVKLPDITKQLIYTVLGVFLAAIIAFIWSLLPLSLRKKSLLKKKEKTIYVEGYGQVHLTKVGHNNAKINWYTTLLSCIVASVLTQILIDMFMLPFFDATLSTVSYSQWLAIRFLTAIPLIIINSTLTFFVFKTISPLINYNYTEDMVENIKKPKFNLGLLTKNKRIKQ